MAEVKVPQIYNLIGQAMRKIGAIGKDDTATNYSGKVMYKFRGIDAVYNALNPVMSELGLFIIPEIQDQIREERKSTNNSNLIYSIVTVKFTMYAPDGSNISGTVIGEGMDSGDKATNKAMSAALKYFCFQTFMIPTEEMKDADGEVQEVTAERSVPKAPNKVNQVRNENPPANAEVSAVSKIPPKNPVFAYIENEQKFMMQKRGDSDIKQTKVWFAKCREGLIAGGVVEDIPADKLTKQQAEQLVEAIYLNCLPDKGERK